MSKLKQDTIFLDDPTLQDGITRFFFIRHALVDKAWRSRMYGALDVQLCTDTLKNQANVYQALSRHLPEKALLFSSPLSRAQDTAKAIFKNHHKGHSLPPMELQEDLREQELGEWAGLTHDEFMDKVESNHPFWGTNATECPPGGESMEDLKLRVGRVIDKLADAHSGENMICVSHGGTIRMALAHALGISADSALRFSVQNLSCTIIEKIGSSYRVVNTNILPPEIYS